MAIQMGLTCGDPSSITVARNAKFGASIFDRALSSSRAIDPPPLDVVRSNGVPRGLFPTPVEVSPVI